MTPTRVASATAIPSDTLAARMFRQPVDIRFADLDPFGHLSAGRYVDILIASRFTFLQKTMSFSADDFIKRGLGIYLAGIEIKYRRPIQGTTTVTVESYSSECEGSRMSVAFKFLSEDGMTVHAEGIMRHSMIDLSTKSPISCPAWAIDIFFMEK